MSALQTFLANLKHAVREREAVAVGGGRFTHSELNEVVEAIERKDALLRQALEALELYKAYGWPDRNGVTTAIKQELSQ